MLKVGGGRRYEQRVAKGTNPLPPTAGEAIGFAPEMRAPFTYHSQVFIG